MKTYIKLYQKELLDVAGFARDTVSTYISSIDLFNDFVRTTFAMDPVTSQTSHLQTWLKTLRPGISRSRLRQHQFALKSFFAFLQKIAVIEKNPAEPLPRLRKKKSEKNRPISSAEAFKLLNIVDRSTWLGRRNHLIIAMLWCLGLRISELTSLTSASFEPDHDPENRIGLLRIKGKNRKQRALFVVDSLYDELSAYLREPRSPKEAQQPLFPGKPDKAISSNRIQKLFKQYTQQAGIRTTITPHVLRHTFATEMYSRGVPLSAVQAMLGHENKAETSLYVHIPDHMKKQALAQVTISGGETWQ
jgi:integrase/recombinase XerD